MKTFQKSMRNTVVALTFACAASAQAQTQTVRPEQVGLSGPRLARVTELIQSRIDDGSISGAVTLVARNGRIAHLEAQGLAGIEAGEPMRSDSIFRIASMTKPITAAAIMMLVEEGKIRLNDPVSRFVPGFDNAEVAILRQQTGAPSFGFGGGPRGGNGPDYYTVPAERALTIVDLLTHTGGVMSGTVGNAGGNPLFETRETMGLGWAEGLADVPLDFEPGSRWSYSGLGGFDVLARIVEIVSAQTFEDFLTERIFEPLDMDPVGFWATDSERERLVVNYSRTADGLAPNANPDMLQSRRYFSGSGGLIATAEAYGRFAMALANGGAYGTHFWVDPDRDLVAILMIQGPGGGLGAAFETAVMQSVTD